MAVQDLWLKRDGFKIYGKYYCPDENSGQLPLIIMSHGFRGSHLGTQAYAEQAYQAGYAVYSYDFVGSGDGSSKQSDGDFLAMSVLTQARDLQAVLGQLQERPEIDPKRVYLMGESQGGFVSAYVAGQIPQEIAGLILIYPAFVLQDDAKKRLEDFRQGPQSCMVMGTQIGAIYNQDALSFDIYQELAGYTKPVLIVHGDSDKIVPLAYSERAQATYQDAKLLVFPGAGHGFHGEDVQRAAQAMLNYLAEREGGE